MIFHEKTWGSRWRSSWDQIGRRNLRRNMVWGRFGAETLRTVLFGTQRRRILTRSMVERPRDAETLPHDVLMFYSWFVFWSVGVQSAAVVIHDDLLMAFSWFSHGFRMAKTRSKGAHRLAEKRG